MVETSISRQLQKIDGVVTVIAFSIRGRMKFRFADGNDAVVTVTAIAEDVAMINGLDDVES